MNILNMIAVSTVATIISFSAFADQNHKLQAPCKSDRNTTQTMPMMGGNQNGMSMMQHMQQRQAMMQVHMVKMETHMENIDASLKQLVELSKNK